MVDRHWTPLMVEEQMAEAADVLDRLPEPKVNGLARSWLPMVREYWESYGWQEATYRRPPPSAAAIDRMDQALHWLAWLDPVEARIVWLRANGEPWKAICWKVGLARAAANEHWLYALCVIAWRLANRKLPRHRSRRRLIAETKTMAAPSRTRSRADTFRADSARERG